jgi:hypothetical protein
MMPVPVDGLDVEVSRQNAPGDSFLLKAEMSGDSRGNDGTLLRRVPVIVRSWDGPNSRVGLEMDLSQMPWGLFDALGKRLSLLLPDADLPEGLESGSESRIERALRHVEHASNRCAEFARLADGDQELWRRSHETWEWIRKYLTSLWVDAEVEGHGTIPTFTDPPPAPLLQEKPAELPLLPGAAATLTMAAKALRATPLATWREAMDPSDPDAPTREEAVQTLLGVARILGPDSKGSSSAEAGEPEAPTASSEEIQPVPDGASVPPKVDDPDQVSFDFAQGYDEGYQMGRRVGLALGARRRSS